MTADQSRDFSPQDPEDLERTQTNKARQGVTGHNVRYVLLFGIVGVVLGFILVYVAILG
jgi:hypothetical protein